MFQFLFRAFGMILLALALIAAILDLTRSIAASSIVMRSFGELWQSLLPASFANAQTSVETYVHPILWNPVLTTLLALPGWLVLFLFAMILMWIGERRSNPYGRFARH